MVELADARDSKSRVRKDVRVQVPPPAPPPFSSRGAQREGLERARGADEQEEKRDAQEHDSPEPRRNSRSHGGAEAQAGKSLLRHHLKARSYTCLGAGGEAAFGRL